MTTSSTERIIKMDFGELMWRFNKRQPAELRIPKVLSYQEIDEFILAIDNLENLIACRLMLFGGLRVGEVINLRVSDIDIERRAVFVDQGKNSRDRWVPLDIGTISLINAYIEDRSMKPHESVIKRCKRSVQRHVSMIAEKAGIHWPVSAHTLRHTCATWQLDKGVPIEVVRANLGHSRISTTSIYLHLNLKQRTKSYSDATRFGI